MIKASFSKIPRTVFRLLTVLKLFGSTLILMGTSPRKVLFRALRSSLPGHRPIALRALFWIFCDRRTTLGELPGNPLSVSCTMGPKTPSH